MKHQHHHEEPAAASAPDPERYDNRVLHEWPRVDDAPRVWIGSLDDYEAGLLHGRWVGVARAPEEVRDDIAAMLSRSPTAESSGQPADRWAIFCAEGFGHHVVDTHTSIDDLCRFGRQVSSYGGAFAAWARLHEHDLARQRRFADTYLGHYASVRDYVELYVDARNVERLAEAAVPAEVRPYLELNVAQMAADLVASGELLVIGNPDGGVWLYDRRAES